MLEAETEIHLQIYWCQRPIKMILVAENLATRFGASGSAVYEHKKKDMEKLEGGACFMFWR